MRVIQATNVNRAWWEAKKLARSEAMITRPSRNGTVKEYPEPVTTQYFYPRERVLFDERRNANPFFHFFESLWMLAGHNDVAFPSIFSSNIKNYAEDDGLMHGAYGHRWRNHFDVDQLRVAVNMIEESLDNRRIVLTMFDPHTDLAVNKKDIPCNTTIYLYRRPDAAGNNVLSMTVCCRSNDIVWGCYGANVVHMSMLQEYLASSAGIGIGHYEHVSNSWHAYDATWNFIGDAESSDQPVDYYRAGIASPHPLMPYFADHKERRDHLERWHADLDFVMGLIRDNNPIYDNVSTQFFQYVARPLWEAWRVYKELPKTSTDFTKAYDALYWCLATDWRIACSEWLQRIEAKRKNKKGN